MQYNTGMVITSDMRLYIRDITAQDIDYICAFNIFYNNINDIKWIDEVLMHYNYNLKQCIDLHTDFKHNINSHCQQNRKNGCIAGHMTEVRTSVSSGEWTDSTYKRLLVCICGVREFLL